MSRSRVAAVGGVLFLGCGCSSLEVWNGECTASDRVVGETGIALDVRKETVRSQEAPVGNLVADAILAAAAGEGAVAALQNAGAIRSEVCGGGERESIPAGPVTEADVEDLLPFENYVAIATLSGTDLLRVLERGVSALPEEAEGWFLQVSGISFTADCANQRQVLTADGGAIATEGERVTDVVVGGAVLNSASIYQIAVNDYVAAGEDGFLAMREASAAATEILYTDTLKDHLAASSPVSPVLDGRITLVGCDLP